MAKQSFGQHKIDMKDGVKLKKQKDIFETRKKLLKRNLKKRKNKNKFD